MEQELKIVGKYRKWWQLHNKCVMVGLVAVSLAILTGWIADRLTENSRYLSTASTVVSIALSLVVIGYAVAQNVRSEINADKLGRLIESLGQRLYRVEEGITKIENQTATQISIQDTNDITTDAKEERDEVFFSLVTTSNTCRLFAYFLLRSHILGKPLRIELFLSIVEPLVKMSTPELRKYVHGILQGMACFLTSFLKVEEQSTVQLVKLPRNFKDHVEAQIELVKQISLEYGKCFARIYNIE